MQHLQELVETLRVQQSQKADYVLPSKNIVMDSGIIRASGRDYKPNQVMHDGLSDKLGIPLGYY
jgi:hypothetical protein